MFAGPLSAKDTRPLQAVADVALGSLPAQAQTTYALVRQGGPFPYAKDGVVFGNRERLLPLNTRGYYREYTVKTPGSQDRGARRIVCGGPATVPDACYYTADHYASFRKIVP
ncbi:ribonuclease [uncultured Rhodoferax sp.]|uniref:ribonuclease n=1 Tax=uncultured Rhodoferax sp. TaxID=223188 RepID=UPI0025E258EE|nr:ribonuclease [uncultured Rhodoferax sp.]